uniref:Putative secreted protein n=1 Tax=Anopheles marajoara TaxID=58244 RepID=A0A2M4CCE0_9DIPT
MLMAAECYLLSYLLLFISHCRTLSLSFWTSRAIPNRWLACDDQTSSVHFHPFNLFMNSIPPVTIELTFWVAIGLSQ